MKTLRVALAGNPNCGKSTLFNCMTGMAEAEGNYPGVTVDTAVGRIRRGDRLLEMTDLPGMYGTRPSSPDEELAVRALLAGSFDVVVSVLDSTNLERGLAMTIQLLHMGRRVVVALNMIDEARRAGSAPDSAVLSRLLGVPVVETCGRTCAGTEELLQAVLTVSSANPRPRRISFGDELDRQLVDIAAQIPPSRVPAAPAYLAASLLEGSEAAWRLVQLSLGRETSARIAHAVEKASKEIARVFGETPDLVVTRARHGIARGVVRECIPGIVRRSTDRDLTRRIDDVLLSRLWGIPVFAAVMYATFWLTFRASAPLAGLVGSLFEALGGIAADVLPPGALSSLVRDGVMGGVGGVLQFLPGMTVLFMVMTLLEDSGYMARAAFLTDGFMHRVGLHGRSFIPLLLGFGCTVPALMATRALEDRRDRLATMLVLPLMSCGARLPVYILLIQAFYPGRQGAMVAMLYAAGAALALGLAGLLRKTVLAGRDAAFVMELPPYRLPTLRSVLKHVWLRVKHYLAKAGTVILAFSALLWLLSYFPVPRPGLGGAMPSGAERLEQSYAGRIGRLLEPLTEPLGFDWRMNTAMLGAMGAKELFISQTAILLSLEDGGNESISSALRARYAPATGLAAMFFILVSPPCVAALAVLRKESGGWRWVVLQFTFLTLLAWLAGFAAVRLAG